MLPQHKIRERNADIKSLVKDLEALGVTIVGKKALIGRLNAADDWRQDFIFWSRGGAAIGLAHVYEGPKAERKDRETRIEMTMQRHGFTPLAAATYTDLLSHPSIMAKAYAQGAVTREQMRTVEEKSLLHKIGAWMNGRSRTLLHTHEVRMAEAKLLRRVIERDPNSPAARRFLGTASEQTPSNGGFGGYSPGTEMAIGVAAAAGGLALSDELFSHTDDLPSHTDHYDATEPLVIGRDDDQQFDYDALDGALGDDASGPSSIYAAVFGVDLGPDPGAYENAFNVDLGTGTHSSPSDDFGSGASFSSDDFGSGSMSGSGSFGPDW